MSEVTAVEALTAAPAAAPSAAPAPAASTPPATPAAPAATPAASAAPAGGDAWWKGFADDTTRGYAETKNWKSPEDAIRSYQNLEKLVGAKANAVMVPGADAKPEEVSAFYDKIGRPGSPDNYPIPDALKEDPLLKAFAPAAHKMGITTSQFEGVANFITEQMQAKQAQEDGVKRASSDADMTALRQENPGVAYDALIENGRRAVRSLALDGDTLGKLEGALGTKGMLQLMGKIGAGSGETPFIEGTPSGGVPTPEAARLQIAALEKDQNWVKAWMQGDADKIAQMKRLRVQAAGGGQ